MHNPASISRQRAIPHIDVPHTQQMITFRLHDALPNWHPPLAEPDKESTEKSKLWFRTFDGELDAGYGRCLLRQDACAQIVRDSFLHDAGLHYELLAWVVMPNHVHVLIHPHRDTTLSRIVQAWKSVTSHRINRVVGTSGSIWQRDYFDRYIRSERHREAARQYIEMNPVKAGLAAAPQSYRWSSAWEGE